MDTKTKRGSVTGLSASDQVAAGRRARQFLPGTEKLQNCPAHCLCLYLCVSESLSEHGHFHTTLKQQQQKDPAHRESDSSDTTMVKSKVNVHHYGQEVRDGFS